MTAGEVGRAAVGQVVAGHRGDDHEPQPHRRGRLGHAAPARRGRAARAGRAVTTLQKRQPRVQRLPGDHEGGRAARPAAADVGAGGLLADRDELGRAHQRLRLDEAARERVLGRHPARQAPALAELGQLVAARRPPARGPRRAPRRSAARRAARRARGPPRGRPRPPPGTARRAPSSTRNARSPTMAVTVANRRGGTLADRGPVRPNDPGAARLRAAGDRALRRGAAAAVVGRRPRRRPVPRLPQQPPRRSSTCASPPTT